MPGAEGDDMVDQRFDAFGHEGLNDVAFDGQTLPRNRPDARRAARHHNGDLTAADLAPGRLDAGDAAIGDANTGDFTVLDDVDTELVGRAGIAPDHGIVTGGAAAPLQQAAADRKSGIVEI